MGFLLSTLVAPSVVVLAAVLLPVTVTTHSGETISGELRTLAAGEVRLDRGGRITSVAVDDIDRLQVSSSAVVTGPATLVTLTGGSKIAVERVALDAETLTLQPRHQPPLNLPVELAKAIRFRAASQAIDPQWLGLVSGESRGDLLVIRRGDDRIDPQTGIVEGIAEGRVLFNLDGDTVAAPIERLEGVVFGGTDRLAENADIRLTDLHGSEWWASGLELDEEQQTLRVKLSETLSHSLPLQQLESIRWSGSLVLLASQPPVSNVVTPAVPTAVDGQLFTTLFAAQPSGDGNLVLYGGAATEYRIDPGYETLVGAVERAEFSPRSSTVNVEIRLDDRPVWTQTLSDGGRRGFEVPLGDARRVSIRIPSGGDGDLGEYVRVVRPRLTK